MPDHFATGVIAGLSRREVIRRSLVGPIAITLAAARVVPCAAGGTPPASPVATGHALIEANALAKGGTDPSLVVVAFTPAEDFVAGHIPGAVTMDWPALELVDTSDASVRAWQGSMERLLAETGIGDASSIVVYDGGTLFAARLWWLLRYLGHDDVRVLDGGLPGWVEAGEETEQGGPRPGQGREASFQGAAQPALLAQKDEVLARIGDPEVVLVDARTPAEYRNAHIPGAVNLNYPLNAEPEAPHFFKSPATLRRMYEEIGATPDKQIIPYCSSGVRSAVTAFALSLIDYRNVALYTGSWQEWGPDASTPKTTGDKP